MKNFFIDHSELEEKLSDYQKGFIKGIYRTVRSIEYTSDTRVEEVNSYMTEKVKSIINTLVKKGEDKGLPKKKVTESFAIKAIKAVVRDGLRNAQMSYTETLTEIFGWTADEITEHLTQTSDMDSILLYDTTNDMQRGIIAGHCLMISRFANLAALGDKFKDTYAPIYKSVTDELAEIFKECPERLSAGTQDKYLEWSDDLTDAFIFTALGFAQNAYMDVLHNACGVSVDELTEYYSQEDNLENWDEHDIDGNPIKIPETPEELLNS